MERRELLRWMVATGGMAALHRLSERDVQQLGAAAHHESAKVAPSSLTPEQAATITAAAERILPRTTTPGATDAGVTAFIDTMLAGWYSATERGAFLTGIATLDDRARKHGARGFVDISIAQQDEMLTTLDTEVTALRAVSGAAANDHWFATLKFLTVWGYCTSEPGMRQTLGAWPLPMRYDGNAPI